MAYRDTGKLPAATALLERVRDALIAKLGPDHPHTLTTLSNLALAYRDSGKLPEAIALYERVRDAQIATLGPDHPDTMTTLANLGIAYNFARRYPEAAALLERVRDANIAKLGPDHPDTLPTLNNLATAYWGAKQLDKSVPLFEDVLKRHEAKLGRQHPNTQRIVANLGVNYKDAGRLKEAIPLLEEAHQAAKRFPELRSMDGQLIDAYTKAGETAKLGDLLQEQLPEARKALPKDSPQLAGLLAQLGLSLLQQQEWAKAEPILRESLAIREKTQPDVWSTFNTQSLLGGALLGQKKYADAEPLLRKGYEGMKRREKTIPPGGSTRIPEALDRLIDLATATNKSDELKKWQAERAKYPQAASTPGEKK
jgi:tetratricopeptide (TPR) repeat protein